MSIKKDLIRVIRFFFCLLVLPIVPLCSFALTRGRGFPKTYSRGVAVQFHNSEHQSEAVCAADVL